MMSRLSGEEQQSDLNMHYGVFWVRVYELLVILRSEVTTKKLGGVLGKFEEMDLKEGHRNRRFFRIKATMDLKLPLKRGTMVFFKEKNPSVHFKYEQLPTFCFACGRLGHQLKDCDALGDLSGEGYEDLEEQDMSYGLWLRVPPLSRTFEDQKCKNSSSSTCSKSLFNISSSQSRCGEKGKEKEDEVEVEQNLKSKENTIANKNGENGQEQNNTLAIELMAESLGVVDISNTGKGNNKNPKGEPVKRRKWTRSKVTKKNSEFPIVHT